MSLVQLQTLTLSALRPTPSQNGARWRGHPFNYSGLCGVLYSALLGLGFSSGARANALTDYVNARDASLSWKQVRAAQLGQGRKIIELDLQSQTWRGIPWKHRLEIVLPSALDRRRHPVSHSALLYITGNYDQGLTTRVLAQFSAWTGAPAAVLYNVPNQPLFGPNSEDRLIALTFTRYLQTGDPTWPLLFPMVKSARAAMTAVSAQFTGSERITRFLVSGASKRGWTTWLTAAVDPRVQAIAPVVYNNLDLAKQIPYQLKTWGRYSEQINDYLRAGLLSTHPTGRMLELEQWVDPWTYRDRLTMPKLIINATNDRYWPLDAASLYFPGLKGEKRILYVPNNEHGIRDVNRPGRAIASLFLSTVRGELLPEVNANAGRVGDFVSINVSTSGHPKSVTFWIARAPTRDFRSAVWQSHTPTQVIGHRYLFRDRAPDAGFESIFAEAQYIRPDGLEYPLSSPLSILSAKASTGPHRSSVGRGGVH